MKNSSSARRKPSATTPWKGPPPRTEGELVKQSAQTARKALTHTSGVLVRCLGKLVDPRLWVRNYPWKSLGIASAAGFFASGSFFSKEEEKPATQRRSAPAPSALTMLLMTGADILKEVGTSFLLQKIKSHGAKEISRDSPPPKP